MAAKPAAMPPIMKSSSEKLPSINLISTLNIKEQQAVTANKPDQVNSFSSKSSIGLIFTTLK